MTKNTAGRGLTAHTAVLYALIKKDLEVLLPWGDHYAYDLAYYSRGKRTSDVSELDKAQFVRVQCKLARISPDGGYITFNAFRVSPGDNGRRSVKRGYRGEAEYFGVYSPDTDKVYLIPVDEVPASVEIRLRLKAARNNQERLIRWAKDYEV
jgi:hypothetical protein